MSDFQAECFGKCMAELVEERRKVERLDYALRVAREALDYVLQDDGLIPRATSACRNAVRVSIKMMDEAVERT